MQSVIDVLEAAKTATNSTNDSQLARRLGITPNAVNNYRRGVSTPNAVVCAKLAEITGISLARVLGIVGEARAISREEKAVWRRLASAAAVLFLVMGSLPSHAHHTGYVNTSPIYALCEIAHGGMVLVREIARTVAGIGIFVTFDRHRCDFIGLSVDSTKSQSFLLHEITKIPISSQS